MSYKFRYLTVTEKKDGRNTGLLVRRLDVSDLNKAGRERRWDELDNEYPREDYLVCYETSQRELPEK